MPENMKASYDEMYDEVSLLMGREMIHDDIGDHDCDGSTVDCDRRHEVMEDAADRRSMTIEEFVVDIYNNYI